MDDVVLKDIVSNVAWLHQSNVVVAGSGDGEQWCGTAIGLCEMVVVEGFSVGRTMVWWVWETKARGHWGLGTESNKGLLDGRGQILMFPSDKNAKCHG